MIKLQGESLQATGPAEERAKQTQIFGDVSGEHVKELHWGFGTFWKVCLTWFGSATAERAGREGGRCRRNCC